MREAANYSTEGTVFEGVYWRSGATDYTIRQQKPADQELIPLNTTVEFKLDKSKMKFKANGKSDEYVVLGQAAATHVATSPAGATPNPQ